MSTAMVAPVTVQQTSSLHRVGLGGLELRPGLTRLLVSVKLVRAADVKRFPRVRTAADVYREFRSMACLDREAFVVLLLDTKNRVTGVNVVSVGSLAASLVHPREVYKTAILGNAAAIIYRHRATGRYFI